MAKMLRRCADCAHYRQQMHGGKWKCEKAGFRFRDSFSPDTIADSCPLDDVPDAPRWVPVSEPPCDTRDVLVLEYDQIWWVGYYTSDGKWLHSSNREIVPASWITHWMEKPPLPKEE